MLDLGNNILLLKNNKMDNNTYLITVSNTFIIIDLSWNSKIIIEYIKKYNFNKIILFFTHGHYDHIGEINELILFKDKITIFISEKEKTLLLSLTTKQPFSYNLFSFKDRIKLYEDNNNLILGSKKFLFLPTPGHSSGSTSIIFDNYIFTGDFLFSDCIGRIDLLTSSKNEMIRSCIDFYKNISNSYIICPGHGNVENFKNIKANNLELIWAIKYGK